MNETASDLILDREEETEEKHPCEHCGGWGYDKLTGRKCAWCGGTGER